MLRQVFLRLLLTAYGVTVLGFAVFALTTAAQGRENLGGVWLGIGAMALRALPPALAGAAVFTLLHRLGSRLWQQPGGRFLFTFLCAAIGYAYAMYVALRWLMFWPIVVIAVGIAAWISTRSSWEGRLWPEICLAAGSGVAAGLIEAYLISLL